MTLFYMLFAVMLNLFQHLVVIKQDEIPNQVWNDDGGMPGMTTGDAWNDDGGWLA